MSKKTVTVEIYQCDHVSEDGERCTVEGEKQIVRKCAMCQKDLCSRHYELWEVKSKPGRVSLSYHFCPEHAREFIDTIAKTLGDTRPVAYAGMAK